MAHLVIKNYITITKKSGAVYYMEKLATFKRRSSELLHRAG